MCSFKLVKMIVVPCTYQMRKYWCETLPICFDDYKTQWDMCVLTYCLTCTCVCVQILMCPVPV